MDALSFALLLVLGVLRCVDTTLFPSRLGIDCVAGCGLALGFGASTPITAYAALRYQLYDHVKPVKVSSKKKMSTHVPTTACKFHKKLRPFRFFFTTNHSLKELLRGQRK